MPVAYFERKEDEGMIRIRKRTTELDMTEGPIMSRLFVFALPIMAMSILQLLFNTTNMVVVGRFTGNHALAAVGSTGALISLLINFFLSLSVGTSVVIAQKFGAGKREEVSEAVHTSIAASVLVGLFVMVLGINLCRPLLVIMGTPPDILDMAASYMRIYFFSVPASMVYDIAAASMRAIGDSRRPMYYLVAAGALNVVINLVLVIVFHLGVVGVACSTVFTQYFALALILTYMCRSHNAIRLMPKQLRIRREPLVQIVKIGIPAGFQGLLFSISNVLIQSGVNSFGSTMVAASAAASNVESFTGTVMGGYYTAAITFTGQNMGAKKFDRIDTLAKVCVVLVFSTWIVMGGTTILLSKPLLSIFTSDPQVIELGALRITVMMMAYFTCGIMNVFPGLSRGMGYSLLPMVCTLVGACLLRIVWINTVFTWHHTEMILFACYPITWAIAGIGQVFCFFYARKRVRQKAALEASAA